MSAKITISAVGLSAVPATDLLMDFKIRKDSDVLFDEPKSKMNVLVKPNGSMPAVVVFTGLLNSTNYIVRVINQCSGAFGEMNYTTPAGAGMVHVEYVGWADSFWTDPEEVLVHDNENMTSVWNVAYASADIPLLVNDYYIEFKGWMGAYETMIVDCTFEDNSHEFFNSNNYIDMSIWPVNANGKHITAMSISVPIIKYRIENNLDIDIEIFQAGNSITQGYVSAHGSFGSVRVLGGYQMFFQALNWDGESYRYWIEYRDNSNALLASNWAYHNIGFYSPMPQATTRIVVVRKELL